MKRRVWTCVLALLAVLTLVLAVVPKYLDPGWELTQYADASGSQAMCYALYSQREDALILVDGGSPVNVETVRQIIDAHGGRVKAWFLTHYHLDHIGAFNALWPEYRDRIETVYVNPLDWETFEQIYHDWDTPEAFSTFLEQTEGAENVVTLHTDDTLEVGGIHVRVFSAFDEHVRELSTDWPNDASLVMKFSLKEDNVLFLGDLSRAAVPLGQYLLDTYGAETLHAKYVQAGHHGNWGQPIAFYEAIHPEVLFSDGPEWLMTGEEYDAKDLQAWCHENGIETYDFRQAPSSFMLK